MLLNNIVELQITGDNIERFINICSYHKINLLDINRTEEVCTLKIVASDFIQIKNIVRKTNVKIKIIKKSGPYFKLRKLFKRKVFIVALLSVIFLLWLSSHFLWRIQFTGNKAISTDMLADYLRNNGIYYGMPLSKIPIYDLKTNLRNSYDEITWVSIYLNGTTLQISIKENNSRQPESKQIASYSNLVSSQNGIVDSILVRKGSSMVKIGDTVSQNDILISGKIEIIADDYTIKETKLCEADGDVYLIYKVPVEEKISYEYLDKEYTGNTIQHKSLFYKNIPLNFFNSDIPYIKYDSVTESMESNILTALSIPIFMKQTTYREYKMTRKKYDISEAEKLINEKLDKIITSLEEKGVQIIEKNVKISTNSAYISLIGSLTVRSDCSRSEAMEENE